MDLKKMAILDRKDTVKITENDAKKIRDAFPDIEVLLCYSVEELIDAGGTDVDMMLTWSTPGNVTPELVEFCRTAPKLKWIQSMITGMDALLASDIGKMGIRLTATRGIHGFSMADQVLAFIFSFLRAFPDMQRFQERKEYPMDAGHLLDESWGKTVGIVGLGRIGQFIAKKCSALGFRVLGLKRRPIECEGVEHCYSNNEMAEMLGQCDFVVLVTPLTPETENLIGAKELKMMKKSARLINVARGGVVDTEALIAALKDGTIAGAGLDAFAEEPLPPSSPLWDLPNVIITPHVAGQTPFYNERAFEVILENIRRFRNDEALLFEE